MKSLFIILLTPPPPPPVQGTQEMVFQRVQFEKFPKKFILLALMFAPMALTSACFTYEPVL